MPAVEIIPDLYTEENTDNQKLANLVDKKLWDDLKKSLGKGCGLAEFEAALAKLIDK